jgi:hypothetical protein
LASWLESGPATCDRDAEKTWRYPFWYVFASSSDLAELFDVDNEAVEVASLKLFEHSGLHMQTDETAPLVVALYFQDFRRLVPRRSKGRLSR